MTEAEWLAETDPTPMLDFLRGRGSDRKLRLLVVASCNRIWSLLPPACRTFTETLEAYSDGEATNAVYRSARDSAFREADAASRASPNTLTYAAASVGISDSPTVASVRSSLDTAATAVGVATADEAPEWQYDYMCDTARSRERVEQCRLVRDIFGSLFFRTITAEPSWRTSTVLTLAQQMYDSRDFSAMPIIADAMQDAGCEDEVILSHCRGDGPHVRGCFVIDLLLGKA